MATEIVKLDFDNEAFVNGIQEGIIQLEKFGDSSAETQATVKLLQDSLNKITAAGPITEISELQTALKGLKLPGDVIKSFDAIFKESGKDVNNLKKLLSDLKKQLDTSLDPKASAELSKAIGVTEKAIKDFDGATKSASKSATTLKQDYKGALDQLQRDLKATGGTWTKELINKAKELGSQKDELGDLQNIIKNFGSDSFAFDATVQGFQSVIGGVQLYTGLLELAGANTEDYQQTIAKLTALQGVASGVQQLYNALQKDSALLLGITQVKTNLVAAATAGYNLVVGSSTGALKAFKIALASTGIGALVVALGLLIANWDELTGAIDGAAQTQKNFNQVREKAAENSAKEISELQITYKLTQDKTLSIEQQRAAAIKLQKTYPETFANFTTEEILAGKATAAYNLLTASILKNAEAQAAKDLVAELTAENLKAQIEANKLIASQAEIDVARRNPLASVKNLVTVGKDFGRFVADGFDLVQEQAEQIKGEIADRNKEINDLINQFIAPEEAKKLEEELKKSEEEKKKKEAEQQKKRDAERAKRAKEAKADRDREKKEADAALKEQEKADAERLRQQRELEAELLKLRLEAENERINLIKDEFEREKILIAFQSGERIVALQNARQEQIRALQTGKDGVALSGVELATAIQDVNAAYNALLETNRLAELNKLADLTNRAFSAAAANRKELEDAGQSGINIGENLATAELTAQFNAGKISREAFEKGVAEIQKAAQQQRLKNTLTFLTAELALYEKASGEEATATRLRLREQISEVTKSIEELNVADQNADIFGERWQQAWQELSIGDKFEQIINSYQQLATTAFNIWNEINKIERENIEKSIKLQEKRVSEATKLAERGNAEYLQQEEERLNELEIKREANARRQLTIDAAIQTSQMLVAIAGAAAQIATGSPFAVIAGIATIGAAIASGLNLINQLKSSAPQLYDGVEYLERNGNPMGKDTIPAMLHEGERIVPSYINQQLYGIPNKDLPRLVEQGLAYQLNHEALKSGIDFNNQLTIENTETNQRLANVEKLLFTLIQKTGGLSITTKGDPNGIVKFMETYAKTQFIINNA